MTILESRVHHDDEASPEPYLQLRQLSMWEFVIKPHCFRDQFAFVLYLYTPKGHGWTKGERVQELTEEHRRTLEEMGYSIAS